MRIALASCILALVHIILMTYLIEEKNELPQEVNTIKQSEIIYSNNGKYLVSINYKERVLKFFDITQGKEIQRFKSDLDINSVSYSPDGKSIAIMNKDKINLFNLETGKLTNTF